MDDEYGLQQRAWRRGSAQWCRVGAAMTLLAGATGIGYALGSAVAGRLADAVGYTAASSVTMTAGAIALALALFRLRRVRTRAAMAEVAWESPALSDASRQRHTA